MIIEGDALEWMAAAALLGYPPFHAIVTDPPYGLASWDWIENKAELADWYERWAGLALDLVLPGAHMLMFGGTRHAHRAVAAVEDAGWEVRDTLVWLYGGGMPKSRKLGDGWGTGLKPAWEPITLFRRPFQGTTIANHAAYSVGGINVDGCRQPEGRHPANVVLDEEAAQQLDGQTAHLKKGGALTGHEPSARSGRTGYGDQDRSQPWEPYGDEGGASRFYYCAKASPGERNAGLEAANDHPTVKPLGLVRWLCRMVVPPGGWVFDPFVGSGTTVCAAALEGFDALGMDNDPAAVLIAQRREAYWRDRATGPRAD